MTDVGGALLPLVLVPGALIGVVALAGCGDDPPPLAAPPASAFLAPAPPPPRRPARRFYLARTSERCEIFREDGEDRTEPFHTPCPEYLRVGERLRISGKTCVLENRADPDREKPVVCPDPLTRFEKEVRAEAR